MAKTVLDKLVFWTDSESSDEDSYPIDELNSRVGTDYGVSFEEAEKVQKDISERIKEVKQVEYLSIVEYSGDYGVKVNLSTPLPKKVAEEVVPQIQKAPVTFKVVGKPMAF